MSEHYKSFHISSNVKHRVSMENLWKSFVRNMSTFCCSSSGLKFFRCRFTSPISTFLLSAYIATMSTSFCGMPFPLDVSHHEPIFL